MENWPCSRYGHSETFKGLGSQSQALFWADLGSDSPFYKESWIQGNSDESSCWKELMGKLAWFPLTSTFFRHPKCECGNGGTTDQPCRANEVVTLMPDLGKSSTETEERWEANTSEMKCFQERASLQSRVLLMIKEIHQSPGSGKNSFCFKSFVNGNVKEVLAGVGVLIIYCELYLWIKST